MTNPLDDPAFHRWAASVREGMLPHLTSSAYVISLVPEGDSDVKFAVETGFAIMLDKPIILAITPGQHVPRKLVAVADAIVEFDHTTEQGRSLGAARLTAELKRLKAQGIG